MMIQILLLVASLSAPPQAPSPIPPQAPPVRLDYPACVSHVAAGGKAILAVGVDAPPGAYRVASLTDTKPGLYECFLDGTPKMRPLAVPQKMAGTVKRLVKQCINGICRLVEVDD